MLQDLQEQMEVQAFMETFKHYLMGDLRMIIDLNEEDEYWLTKQYGVTRWKLPLNAGWCSLFILRWYINTDQHIHSIGTNKKVAGLTGLELQVSTLKKQVSRLNDKLATFDAFFAKSKAKGKEMKKNIKSLGKSLDNLHAEGLVQKFLASDGFSKVQGELPSLDVSVGFERSLSMHQTKDEFAAISKYVVKPLSVILQLEPKKLVHPANVLVPKDTHVSPPIVKESTMTPISKSLELSANVAPVSSAVASEQNEEQVNAEVDGSDLEMADGAAPSKSGESERVSSVPTDVVVALSVGGKGDGSAPFSTVEEFGFSPSALLVAFPFLLLLVSSIDGLVLIPTDTSWLRNSSFIGASPVNTSAFRFKIFRRCVIQNLWNRTVASIISSLYLLSCSVVGVWFPST
ncbi:hypothetical protein Tco_0301075 [Tanacetum coccineum]